MRIYKMLFMALFLAVFIAGCADDNGGLPDTTPLTVSSTNPADTATSVATNRKITAIFNLPVDPGTCTTTTFTVERMGTLVLGSVTCIDKTAIFTPDSNLAASTLYLAAITTGLKGQAGNTLAVNKLWSFTTGTTTDTTAPTVSSTYPVDTDTDVPINANISATFSEAMDPATITGTTFTVTAPGPTPVSGTVTSAGSVATFDPTSNLAASTVYTATITTGVEDLAGNALAVNKVWTFTTGTSVAAGPAPVDLASAGTYGIISGAAVTLNGSASIIGDLAIDPANALTGTGTVSGVINNGNALAHQARLDQNDAFTDASTRVSPTPCAVSGNLVAMPPPPCGDNTGTFSPGLYNSGSTLNIADGGTIILDAQGDANAVFIFQMGTALTTGTASTVTLANGAQAKNVWWVAPSGATLGVSSVFAGTVLADTGAVTVNNGATVTGRLFSNTAAATVETGSTVTVPGP